MKYKEFEACIAAGLDLWMWINGKYPKEFMADVIAFHNVRAMVDNHTESELAKAAKRNAKMR